VVFGGHAEEPVAAVRESLARGDRLAHGAGGVGSEVGGGAGGHEHGTVCVVSERGSRRERARDVGSADGAAARGVREAGRGVAATTGRGGRAGGATDWEMAGACAGGGEVVHGHAAAGRAAAGVRVGHARAEGETGMGPARARGVFVAHQPPGGGPGGVVAVVCAVDAGGSGVSSGQERLGIAAGVSPEDGAGAGAHPGVFPGAGVVADAGTMDGEQRLGHMCAPVVEGTGRTTLDGRGVTDGHWCGIAVAGGGATRKRAGATTGAPELGLAQTVQDPAKCSAENRPQKVISACKSSQACFAGSHPYIQ